MGNNVNKINIIDPYEDINYDENISEIRKTRAKTKEQNSTIVLENQYDLRINPSKNILFDTEYLELYKKKNNSKKKNKRKYKIRRNVKSLNKPPKNTKRKSLKKTGKRSKITSKNAKNAKNAKKIIYKREKISMIDRKKVLFDQKYICNFCDKMLDPNHEFDHIIPLCCGGLNKYKNYQALCKECHQYKSDFLDDRIIKPMIEKNKKYDPSKISYILKKIYQNHYD